MTFEEEEEEETWLTICLFLHSLQVLRGTHLHTYTPT